MYKEGKRGTPHALKVDGLLRKFRISSESMLGLQGVSPSVVQMGTEVEEDEEERRHKPGREA